MDVLNELAIGLIHFVGAFVFVVEDWASTLALDGLVILVSDKVSSLISTIILVHENPLDHWREIGVLNYVDLLAQLLLCFQFKSFLDFGSGALGVIAAHILACLYQLLLLKEELELVGIVARIKVGKSIELVYLINVVEAKTT